MKTFKTLLLIQIITLNAFGQSFDRQAMMNAREGVLKGIIVDKDTQKPVEFTSVALYSLRDSSLVTGSISANDGSFAMNELPYGRFYLVAKFIGYEKNGVDEIRITPKTKYVDVGSIGLVQSTQELEEVEIIAEQAHVEYKIDRKIINVGQDINAATGTAADVLQNTPSVTVDIDGNVSLRGNDNFTVLIDGKPTPLSGNDALQQIPASAIRNIEIITNPSAKFDPDGMAGIINIISKKNALQGLSGVVNAKIGTRDKYSGDFLLNYKTDRATIFAGATYRDENYFGSMESLRELGEQGELRYDEIRGERDMNRLGKEIKAGIDYSINENNIIGFSAELGSRSFGYGGIQKRHLYDDANTYDNYFVNDNYTTHGGDYYNLNLNYTHRFEKPGHEIVSFISFSDETGDDYDTNVENPADSDYDIDPLGIPYTLRASETGDEIEIRGQIDYTLPIGENGKLEAGYQTRIDDETEYYVFEDFDPDLQQWQENDTYSSSTDFYRNIQALYTTYGNKLGNYSYQAGLRAEYTDRRILNPETDVTNEINRIDFFPSMHISRQFKNNNQLMLSYSRRINRPRGWSLEPFLSYMNSTTLRRGDPRLEPEYMNSYELGYQKTFGKSFVALEAYYKNTVNKIERIQEIYDFEQGITLMTFDNISKDHSFGTELMVNYASLKWLNLNASTSLYRYWIEGEIDGVEIDTRSNNWNARLNATFNISTKTRVQLTGMYYGPSVTAQGERKAFFFSNLSVRQDLLDRKLAATLQLRDIFGSMRHEMTSFGPSFTSYMKFNREPQVLMLSLSYKINNFRQRQSGSSGMEGSEDMEGGMF